LVLRGFIQVDIKSFAKLGKETIMGGSLEINSILALLLLIKSGRLNRKEKICDIMKLSF